MTLSVVIITYNEEANLPRTLASVAPLVRELGGEIIVVDSHSTDRTRAIAESFGAKVFEEDWKGFAAQKNSALAKASGDYVLSLDADEEVSPELTAEIRGALNQKPQVAYRIRRRNLFMGRWIRRGGFYPDPKLRLFARGSGEFPDRLVHEDFKLRPPYRPSGWELGDLIHHAYPTLKVYLEHMRRYADLGATMISNKPRWWLWLNRWLNPPLTFFYNYVVRLGFLDGREGFLLHRHHARYVGWKYAKALELARKSR